MQELTLMLFGPFVRRPHKEIVRNDIWQASNMTSQLQYLTTNLDGDYFVTQFT